jgi:hypothetical protein
VRALSNALRRQAMAREAAAVQAGEEAITAP